VTGREYVVVLCRRWYLLVTGLVVGLVVAWGLTAFTPRVYEAAATILVTPRQANDGGELIELPQQRLATYAALLTSNKVLGEAGRSMQPVADAGALSGAVRAIVKPDTALLQVSATDGDPVRAARIANLVADRFVANVAEIERPFPTQPDGNPALSEPVVSAEVFDRAVPSSTPESPSPLLNFTLGPLLGVLLAAGVALGLNAAGGRAEPAGVTQPEGDRDDSHRRNSEEPAWSPGIGEGEIDPRVPTTVVVNTGGSVGNGRQAPSPFPRVPERKTPSP
jgi:capsular polysaccharide biosynthesis protein